MAQATLNGQLVYDGREMCEVRFQWGSTPAYGMDTPWQGAIFTTGMTFSQTIFNLGEGLMYHFRAQARNSKGVISGQDMVFATLISLGPLTLVQEELLLEAST